MKFTIMGTAAAAALAFTAPANAAEFVVPLEAGPNGTLAGEFGNVVTRTGSFMDTFRFNVPEAGLVSGTISTIRLSNVLNIDFVEVLLNGTAFTLSRSGPAEFGFIASQAVEAGAQTLTVNGRSGGNGTFAGTIEFMPNDVVAPVPEPATWALLLLGFAGVGFSMRRKAQPVRVRYDMA